MITHLHQAHIVEIDKVYIFADKIQTGKLSI